MPVLSEEDLEFFDREGCAHVPTARIFAAIASSCCSPATASSAPLR